MQSLNELEKEVLEVYDTWMHAYLNGDIRTYGHYLDDRYHFIGSTNNEEFLDKPDTVRFFELTADQLDGKTGIRNNTRIVEHIGGLVFITELLDAYFLADGNWNYYGRFRFTSVLEKKPEGWRFLYQHFSTPDSKAEAGETIGYDTIHAENLQLREAIRRRTAELEQKNRDAQVEAALERVRAQSMQMQHSSQLGNTAQVFHQQLLALGIDSEFSYLWLPDEAASNHLFWATWHETDGDRMVFRNKAVVYPLDKTEPAIAECYRAWESGHPVHVNPVAPGDVPAYFDTWEELLRGVGKFRPEFYPDGIYYIDAYMQYGCFGIMIRRPLTSEETTILNRFSVEFERTYTRFLDLQKAEAQAREAQIEAALERVRSRTMGMQRSEELQDAAVLLFQQVVALGVPAFGTGFNIWDDDRKYATAWMAGKDRMQPPFKTSSSEDIFLRIYEAAQQGETLFVEEQHGEALTAHYAYMNSIPAFREIANKMAAAGQTFPTFQIMHCSFFSHGYLMFISFEPVPDAHAVFKRFAKVFEQTYTRFLDLQKAETQAREAQLELSLEKIRAQVTSMQESTDLLDIMVNIRSEFVALGHEAQYFWYMHWLPDKYEKAMTSGDGTQVGMIMTLPRHIHGDIPLVANWERGTEPTLIFVMDVDTAVDYVDKMITLGDFQQVDPHAPTLDDIRHIGGLTFVMARTSQGEIGYSLSGEVHDPPAEAVNTLARFAGVFDLAYKRFEDLKKAEKDVLEIKAARKKAEEALNELKATQAQLIQSEKMASLGELTAGIAHEIKNPLNFVNNFAEVSGELFDELKATTDPEQRAELIGLLQNNLDKINEHGKRADAIVRSMLQHSRSEGGKKEPTDINALADEYLRLAYHGLRAKDKSFNANFAADLDPTVPRIDIIPQDIGRVLLNLVNNAFYAVSERQRRGEKDYVPTVTVRTTRTGDSVEIHVTDNGSGIPKSVRDKIFQPFFTTKPTGQGTGLGLSLAYDIVTKGHRGALRVSTAENEGTTFTIVLPRQS